MAGELAVELSDLRGWEQQVGRAGSASTALSGFISSNVPDGDFGRILDLITGDYEAMIPQALGALTEDGSRLARTSATLGDIARDYQRTDSQVAQGFGKGARISDDGRADGFSDSGEVAASTPSSGGETLPEVSFGWLFDKACELISWVGGPDLRATVTEWIAGDVGKASMQASAWENGSTALLAVQGNLDRGSCAIAGTWTGAAAASASAYMDQWLSSLREQASAMTQIAGHLRDMVGQAVDMAQVVVDIVKEICSIISAGWSMAAIPIYGEIKLVDKVKDAIKLVNDARKVIAVFWNALKMVKDAIVMAAHSFSVDALPAEPTVPA